MTEQSITSVVENETTARENEATAVTPPAGETTPPAAETTPAETPVSSVETKSVADQAKAMIPKAKQVYSPIKKDGGEKNNKWLDLGLADMKPRLVELGFVQVSVAGCEELVFAKKDEFEGLTSIFRVYTGISKATGRSRGPGQDAIRLVVVRKIDDEMRVVKSFPAVRRTGTWMKNLDDRLASAKIAALPVDETALSEDDLLEGRTAPRAFPTVRPNCPKCGAECTSVKNGKKGPFYGCSRFPECNGLVDANAWAIEVANQEAELAAMEAEEAAKIREQEEAEIAAV